MHPASHLVDLPQIFSVVSTRETGPEVSTGREFLWTPYNDPALQAISLDWLREEAEWGIWRSVVPLVCFNIVKFHHVDWVERQFSGEQLVPENPDVPKGRRCAREVRSDTHRPTRRKRGARDRRGAAGPCIEQVKPRREQLDVESKEEEEYDRQEKHGDIPASEDYSPPPPPLGSQT
ncbi:hypothetical protein Ahy_B02g058127 [Arachis hypogaea]|uniref:Aminotransferase-like plant mobile domain-containing protein n=1 Tax=Arachis hypogaea TaxID=3818 RepID=A0A445ADV9_ARAHY|nr:hypothetical protein Ahy_B02g058127 [Arachis hypogaea]